MKGLKDKVVIVTGGARGIGAALCRRFVAEGSRVALFDVLAAEAEALATELSADGALARGYEVDISDAAAVTAAVAQVEAECGPIDVLVNNAGLNRPVRFVDSEQAQWQLMIA
jgi:2-hydroxycyclohexanecarboxyl-CoA dehydrogenase